jgi:hypothetical protein
MTTHASPRKVDIYDIANRVWDTADELRDNPHMDNGDDIPPRTTVRPRNRRLLHFGLRKSRDNLRALLA